MLVAPKNKTKSPTSTNSNRSNTTFIQPKLNIGKSNDKYEVEADKAADQIVEKSNESSNTFFTPSTENIQSKGKKEGGIDQKPVVNKINPGVQLKPISTDFVKEKNIQKKEDEEVQTKTESKEELAIQPKTESKTSIENNPVQAKTKHLKNTSLISIAEQNLQKKEDEEIQEKEEEKKEATIQKSDGLGTEDTSNIENSLASSKGGGSPLSSNTQSEMESGFGADFSRVRVHSDSNSVQMNQDLGSQAFTNGNDIYFNEGKYDTNNDSGKHLLAHELTHTVQQGASPNTIQKAGEQKPTELGSPQTIIDISKGLNLSKDWIDYIASQKRSKHHSIKVKIGSNFEGTIIVKQGKKAKEGEKQVYELANKEKGTYLEVKGMSFLQPLKDKGLFPILALSKFGEDQSTKGFLSIRTESKAFTSSNKKFVSTLSNNLEALGFNGLSKFKPPENLVNTYENGGVNLQVNDLSIGVDGFIQATGSIGITNSKFTFELSSKVNVKGLAEGDFNLSRGEDGKLSGKASISADIANVNANITIEYIKGAVVIQGTGRMNSEKFSGEITLLVTDEARSKKMMNAALGVETMDAAKENAAPTKPVKATPKTSKNQVLAGWGMVEATITQWLQGTAKIGIDNKGHVTIVGEIKVPNEVKLMEQQGKKQDLFDVEIRAGYGIPLVGQAFLFASIGMFANAGFGPLVLKGVAFTGTYSTDPKVLQNFSITGTLGINAFVIIGLKAEAGVGITIIGHDVKAGVSVTAAAGLKAYAEATPTFEYKEAKKPDGGKVGESRLKGHFEAAAQLFLQLAGSLFYELDSPWWSPAPDGREDFPLGEVQYPIGDSMGIGADIDWLVGGEKPPELKFKPVEFDPSKFTADVMAEPPPKKSGKSEAKPKGKFENKGGSGNKTTDPKATGKGKGLPENGKKKENLKNLPDEQKYMRGLDELSTLEKKKPKPTLSVVEAKMKRIKSKYGLQKVQIKSRKDGEVTIYVAHKKQNNSRHLLRIPLMSLKEAIKLRHAAMTDLRVREGKEMDPKASTMEEAKAKAMITAWLKAHPVVEIAKVVDGKQTWDYFIDFGDKSNTEKGKLKGGVTPERKIDKDNIDANAKKVLDDLLKMEMPFTNVSKEKHKLDFELKNNKLVLFRKSIPEDIEFHIDKIKVAHKKEEDAKTKRDVGKALGDIVTTWGNIEAIIYGNDFQVLFTRDKKLDDGRIKKVKDDSFPIHKGEKVKLHLNEIAKYLDDVPEIDKDGKFIAGTSQERPKSKQVDFQKTKAKKFKTSEDTEISSSEGKTMTAQVLSRIGPDNSNTSGSQPTDNGYSKLYKELKNNGRDIVAAHLLNHQLFGTGANTKNLTPIPSAKNNPTMEQNMEQEAKNAVLKENKVIEYVVTVHYENSIPSSIPDTIDKGEPGGIEADYLIPTKISATLYELESKPTGSKGKKDYKSWEGNHVKKLNTTDVTINYKTDLKISRKGTGNIIELEKLRNKLQDKFRKTPDLVWWPTKGAKAVMDDKTSFKEPLIQIGGGENSYQESPEYKALYKEFLEKKERLGTKNNVSQNGFQGYINDKNEELVELIQKVSIESSMEAIYSDNFGKVKLTNVPKKKFNEIPENEPPKKDKIEPGSSLWAHKNSIRKNYLSEYKDGKEKEEALGNLIEELKEGIKDKAHILFTKMHKKLHSDSPEANDNLIKAINDLYSGYDKYLKDKVEVIVNYDESPYTIKAENDYQEVRDMYAKLIADYTKNESNIEPNIKSSLKKKLNGLNERLSHVKTNFHELLTAIRKEKERIPNLVPVMLAAMAVRSPDSYLNAIARKAKLIIPVDNDKKGTVLKLMGDLKEDAALEYGRKVIKIYSSDLRDSWNDFYEAHINGGAIKGDTATFIKDSPQLKTLYTVIKDNKAKKPTDTAEENE